MFKEKLRGFIEHKYTTNFILAVIIYNTIALGLLTYPNICKIAGDFLQVTCFLCVIIFTIEISIKLFVYGKSFFKDGWNTFDFILIAMSWIPTGGVFSSFRALRVLRALRALRLVTRLQKLRIIVQAIIESIPNVMWACILLLLIFYIFSIMGTTIYGEGFPQFFGTIGKSMVTLFQMVTLDDWAAGIARPVCKVHPFGWFYFISFILISSFIVMNVIVGVIVNAIGEISEKAKLMKERKNRKNKTEIERELNKLKRQIAKVELLLQAQKEEGEI